MRSLSDLLESEAADAGQQRDVKPFPDVKSFADASANAPFVEALRALPAAVYLTDAAGRITFYNDAAADLWGSRPKLWSDRWTGFCNLFQPDGTPVPRAESPVALAIADNRPIHGAQTVAERPDGSRVTVATHVTPLRDKSGAVSGAVTMLLDVTGRDAAEHSHHRLAAIVESSSDAIVSKDLNGIVMTWNRGAERLFGYSEREMRGQSITLLIPPNLRNEETDILARIRRGESVEHYETIRRRKDGALIDVSLSISPIRAGDGRIVGASKIARDISDRKRKEEHIAFLAREVDHRSNNLLSLVQAIVHLTKAESPDELRSGIDGRIRALANAHTLLTHSRWTGADLGSLVAKELAPYQQSGRQRISMRGPELMLGPRTAQALAVTFHELTTNAVKYGALSRPSGKVDVEWRRNGDGSLSILWSERGGPTAKVPTRNGFGTTVIARMIRDQLRGEVGFDWNPNGLACEILVAEPCFTS